MLSIERRSGQGEVGLHVSGLQLPGGVFCVGSIHLASFRVGKAAQWFFGFASAVTLHR